MLSDQQILALVQGSESHLVERKRSLPNQADIRKALVAFANTVASGEDAVLAIGMADDGQVVGVSNADKIQREVRQTAEQDCYPPIQCHPRLLSVDGKEIVAIVIPSSTTKPHFAGPAYVRVGSESVRATERVYEDLIASRHDKARVILDWKLKLVSVRFLRANPVRLTRIGFPRQPEFRDYRIERCTPQYVTFIDLASSVIRSASLEKVSISFDCDRRRLKLEIDDAP